LPVMHTETNLMDANEAPAWLRKEWANMFRLREDGVPIIGFTWYSLTDQVDWDTALREDNGNVNPLGLYDLNRKIRPVGEAYRKHVAQWCDILQADGLCFSLNMPLVTGKGPWSLGVEPQATAWRGRLRLPAQRAGFLE